MRIIRHASVPQQLNREWDSSETQSCDPGTFCGIAETVKTISFSSSPGFAVSRSIQLLGNLLRRSNQAIGRIAIRCSAIRRSAIRRSAFAHVVILAGIFAGWGIPPASAQLNLPGIPTTPPSLQQTPPPTNAPFQSDNQNIGSQANDSRGGIGGVSGGGGTLPQNAGQQHRVYDLRPYTGYLTRMDRPEQAVVDWVLRETGTDVWFTQPFGFLNADRDSMAVYHTREMHEVVSSVVERFVAGEKDQQMIHLRLMTVGNANWRSRAHMLMQHVNVDSPGVQAWLLSKENAALVLSLLRSRTDAREVQDLNLPIYNGQTERLASTVGRTYIRNVRPASSGWPPYEPETGEVQEGYRLSISPLLSVDGRSVDCVIQAEIDQVDDLNPVDLELPLPTGQTHRTRIDVPQVVSWRLHERFRWPSDMVLLLSCGVVASPERTTSSMPLFSMDRLTGSAGRADALMFVEHRGRATENLTTIPAAAAAAAGRGPAASAAMLQGGSSRGRY